MSEVILDAQGLGKKYLLHHRAAGYDTLREKLGDGLRRLFRAGSAASAASELPLEEFWALRGASLQIRQGESVGLIGRNGAGKSTLLKIISRITEPTEGRLRICGRVASLLEVGTGFHPELTGRENIFLNGAILVTAAATFHGTGHEDVADISDAYLLLAPLLGTSLASTLFAVALLFSGQNATLTGTLAGQIVMEGFLNIRLRPWLRRLITRLIAIIPALITVYFYGERGTGQLLILSQVILSLQLPFAVFPLVMFTSDRRKMGDLVAPKWMLALAWPVAVLIAGLNAWLLWQTFFK